jgi:SAM-dependent methyltransferase
MTRFSYAQYEEALRDPAFIADLQRPHVARFAGAGPVLDLGCGRGIFLDLLRAAGIGAFGVDRDPVLVQVARAAGHEVAEADIFDFLRTTATRFGGVFCSHLLEHLPFDAVLTLIEDVARCLEPAGVFVAVFPNPESVRMQLSGFWKDPEHVRFYHPDLIGAVCAHYGLAVIGGSFQNATPYRLEVPWLGGAHIDGCTIPEPTAVSAAGVAAPPAAATVEGPGEARSGKKPGEEAHNAGPARSANEQSDPACAEAAPAADGGAPKGAEEGLPPLSSGDVRSRGTGSGRDSDHGRTASWMSRQLDIYYPRTKYVMRLLDALRAELLAAVRSAAAHVADENSRIVGAVEAELRAARQAIDRIVDMQDRMLTGLASLNANVESFNAELAASIESFNRRIGPLADAMNAMWAAPDEAVIVCRKADRNASPPGGGAVRA